MTQLIEEVRKSKKKVLLSTTTQEKIKNEKLSVFLFLIDCNSLLSPLILLLRYHNQYNRNYHSTRHFVTSALVFPTKEN